MKEALIFLNNETRLWNGMEKLAFDHVGHTVHSTAEIKAVIKYRGGGAAHETLVSRVCVRVVLYCTAE